MGSVSSSAPFASRTEFKLLATDEPQGRTGPYSVGAIQSIELPFEDRAADWTLPFYEALRGWALRCWVGSEFDFCVIRVHGNVKRQEFHSTLFRVKDPWTTVALEDDFHALWVPEDGVHVLNRKVNLPNLIERLLTFYNGVVVDHVREQESRLFLPEPAREIGPVLCIWANRREPLIIERAEVDVLVSAVAGERRSPRLRLNPQLPQYRPQ